MSSLLLTDYANLPIIKFVEQLTTTKGSQCTFDDLKAELSKTHGEENVPVYNIQLKEDDNLCLIYNIPSNYPYNKLIMKIPLVDFEHNLIIEDEYENEITDLKSAFLDCYDFNLTKFEEEIKKLDWSEELTNPTNDFEFLKRRIEGMILI